MITIFYLVILVYCSGTAFAQTCNIDSSDQLKKYSSIALSIIDKENEFLKKNQLSANPKTPGSFVLTYSLDIKRRRNVIDLQSAYPYYRLQLIPGSNCLVNFFDFALLKSGNHWYANPPHLKWTTQQTIDLATRYAKSILGSQMPSNLALAFAKANPQVDFPRYLDFSWIVFWTRFDNEGHKFRDDSLIVQLTDGFGPISLSYNFSSRYKDTSLIQITKDRATVLAKEDAEALLKWKPGAQWLNGFELVDPPVIDLQVVNPNYLISKQDIKSVSEDFAPEARLAWVATYHKRYIGKFYEQTGPIDGAIQVWIDVENGQFLGGDLN